MYYSRRVVWRANGVLSPCLFWLWMLNQQIKREQGQYMLLCKYLIKYCGTYRQWKQCFWNLTLTIWKPRMTAKRSSLYLLCPQGNGFPQSSGVPMGLQAQLGMKEEQVTWSPLSWHSGEILVEAGRVLVWWCTDLRGGKVRVTGCYWQLLHGWSCCLPC